LTFRTWFLERLREHGHAVLRALTVTDDDFIAGAIEVLHAQSQTLHQAQSSAIHERSHEPFVVGELREDRLDFVARHDHGQAFGLPGADHFAQIADLTIQHMTVQKQQGAEGLVLRRGTYVFVDGQV
jgi:hypothetical protein